MMIFPMLFKRSSFIAFPSSDGSSVLSSSGELSTYLLSVSSLFGCDMSSGLSVFRSIGVFVCVVAFASLLFFWIGIGVIEFVFEGTS